MKDVEKSFTLGCRMNETVVEQIYNQVFLKLRQRNIDLFLCGGASNKDHKSRRDKLRERLKNYKSLSIFYPEDMFMELLNRKKYDLLKLETFLAQNSDYIMIICESPGSFVELGAFTNNKETLKKVVVLIQTKYKNSKSFIMLGPVRYIQSFDKKNVIFFNSDLNELEEAVTKYLKLKHSLFGNEKFSRKYGQYTKDVDLITGQFNFICILLYFYESVESRELTEIMKMLCTKKNIDDSAFYILYNAALKRLYKEKMLVKDTVGDESYYKLTEKGYSAVKELMKDVVVDNRDKLINGIRLKILSAQYR